MQITYRSRLFVPRHLTPRFDYRDDARFFTQQRRTGARFRRHYHHAAASACRRAISARATPVDSSTSSPPQISRQVRGRPMATCHFSTGRHFRDMPDKPHDARKYARLHAAITPPPRYLCAMTAIRHLRQYMLAMRADIAPARFIQVSILSRCASTLRSPRNVE